MSNPRPCLAAEAVSRARSLLARMARGMTDGATYQLGTGDYRADSADVPWTTNGGALGSDCAGFAIAWCYKLQRHRPGYNHGAWASVSDDINCNSAIEDAEHGADLFELVIGEPQPGDLLCYPTIPKIGTAGPWIGHVSIVLNCPVLDTPGSAWKPGRYDMLDVAQCHGPNGFSPPIVETDGSIWLHHDTTWPKPADRTRVLRAKP